MTSLNEVTSSMVLRHQVLTERNSINPHGVDVSDIYHLTACTTREENRQTPIFALKTSWDIERIESLLDDFVSLHFYQFHASSQYACGKAASQFNLSRQILPSRLGFGIVVKTLQYALRLPIIHFDHLERGSDQA